MEVCGWLQQCVGIFAFLSVYGLTLSMKKQYKDLEFSGKEATLFVVKRYLHLVFMFLIPYFLCFGVTYGLGYHRYNNSLWENVISAFADILCVGRLFGTRLLIPTWWYLSLEVMLIVFLPVQKIWLAVSRSNSDSGNQMAGYAEPDVHVSFYSTSGSVFRRPGYLCQTESMESSSCKVPE